MPDYLIFQLVASIGAMGEFAGHDRRGSLALPGRAAILGLLGAALGRRRGEDMADLDALGVAVAGFGPMQGLRDYHTVQTVPSAAVRAPQSRPEALAAAGLRVNTALTTRDYRTDCVFGAVLWGGDLPALCDALRAPVFATWLGRKSCPFSAPFDPQVLTAVNPAQALTALRLPPWVGARDMAVIVADEGTDLEAPARIEARHDMPLDRTLWHFGSRRVAVAHPQIRTGEVPV